MKFKLFYLSLIMFYSCSNIDKRTTSLFNFIPSDSQVLININDLNNTKEILNKNKLLPIILSSTKEISSQLDLLSKKNSEREGLLSLSKYGKQEIAYTYIRKSNSFDSILVGDKLKNTYQNKEIFIDKINDKEVFKVIIDKYIVSSNKDIVLENIIRDFNSTNINYNLELKNIRKTTDANEPFNIYTKSDDINTLQNKLSKATFFPNSETSWIGYDFNYSLEDLYLTGITRISDSINGKVSILKNLISSSIETDRIIPNSFLAFLTLSIDNSERFIFNLKDYLNYYGTSTQNLKFNSLKIVNEISFVEDQEKFIILNLKNTDQIDNYFNLEQYDDNLNIKKILIDDELNILLKNIDQEIILEYAVILENKLIASKTVSQLKKIINSQIIKDNLGSNNKYLNFKEQKSDNYSFLWVGNNKLLNSKIYNSRILDNDEYPYTSFSGRVNQDITLLEFNLTKVNLVSTSEDVYTEFFVTFDKEIISDPSWLENHLNNEFDIAFQDSENYLYYLSNKGTLNWKKKLEGRIIGDIEQVDIFKNGRKQMIFKTSEKLYLLDRNGNEVKQLSFPIKSNIDYPVSIFDYEKNRNYRFLIIEDNLIKMYDSNGKIVSGFEPPIFESKIIMNPIHIRIDRKDYIIIKLENGTLKILDRRGRDRVIVNEKIQFSNNSIFSYLDNFTTTDTQGNLIKIDENGNLIKENLNLSDENFIDIVNNSLVYLNENRLTIKGITIELPFSKFSKPKIFINSNVMLVGITDLNEDKIYLYKDNGDLVKGFPIKGKSVVDIKDSDNDGKIEIISKLDQFSIVSYEINLSQN